MMEDYKAEIKEKICCICCSINDLCILEAIYKIVSSIAKKGGAK